MLKVLKFGGSSLADAQQFAKVKAIVEADESRRVVIVSAPGKRFSGDHKITDLLYLCAAVLKGLQRMRLGRTGGAAATVPSGLSS